MPAQSLVKASKYFTNTLPHLVSFHRSVKKKNSYLSVMFQPFTHTLKGFRLILIQYNLMTTIQATCLKSLHPSNQGSTRIMCSQGKREEHEAEPGPEKTQNKTEAPPETVCCCSPVLYKQSERNLLSWGMWQHVYTALHSQFSHGIYNP